MRAYNKAPRSFWKGYLKLSPASPVAMTPAVREKEVGSGINAIAHPIDDHGRKCTSGFEFNESLAADPIR